MTQPDKAALADNFHPCKSLPDCMMPDGGECCAGYVALYDAYWHLRRSAEGMREATIEECAKRADKWFDSLDWEGMQHEGNRSIAYEVLMDAIRALAAPYAKDRP